MAMTSSLLIAMTCFPSWRWHPHRHNDHMLTFMAMTSSPLWWCHPDLHGNDIFTFISDDTLTSMAMGGLPSWRWHPHFHYWWHPHLHGDDILEFLDSGLREGGVGFEARCCVDVHIRARIRSTILVHSEGKRECKLSKRKRHIWISL